MNPEQQRDEELWQIAKARVGFRWSFACYFIVNAMLVAIWFFNSSANRYFWPAWPMMGWGVGIAFQYFHAFHGNKFASAREEYEKLKRQQN
jgi:hypothetical protein